MIVIESRRGGRLAVTGGFFLMAAFLTLGVGVVGAFAALYVPVHEWGHWLCLRAQHIPVREVKLSAFGVQMRRGRAFASFGQQAVCALSGPLFPLPVGVLLWLLGMWEPVLRIGGAVFWGLSLFHLLPVWPLDGGQALFALLSGRFRTFVAETITRWLSFLFLFLLMTLGFWGLLEQNGNVSLLLLCGYLLLCLLSRPVG